MCTCPDTSFGGYTNFNRYFFAQVGKDAAIVDERFNGGGALATDIIEFLQRQAPEPRGHAGRRGRGPAPGRDLRAQGHAHQRDSPARAATPCHTISRRRASGPLIGKRTWGGLVGRAGGPSLMDGGFVSAPSSGVWSPEDELDRGEYRHRPGHRGRARPRPGPPGQGPAARQGHRGRDGRAGQEPRGQAQAPRLPGPLQEEVGDEGQPFGRRVSAMKAPGIPSRAKMKVFQRMGSQGEASTAATGAR